MFRVILFLIVAVGVLYLVWRMIVPLRLKPRHTVLVSLLLCASIVTFPIYLLLQHSESALIVPFGRFAVIAGGVASFLLFFTLLKDLVWIVLRLVKPSLATPAYQRTVVINFMVMAAVFCSIAYHQAMTPKLIDANIPISKEYAGLSDMKIVQLSDLHFTRLTSAEWREKIVEKVNEADADLVVITGDFADMHLPDVDGVLNPLSKIKSRYGVYGVLGNHEYYGGQVEVWIEKLRSLGITILLNEHVVIDYNNSPLLLAGVTDNAAASFGKEVIDAEKAMGQGREGALKILLSHQPLNVYEAEEAGFDVQLSGHTHAGQFYPWTLAVGQVQPFLRGLYEVGRVQLYVNQGTGYWAIPMRFGTKSEISVLRLVSE